MSAFTDVRSPAIAASINGVQLQPTTGSAAPPSISLSSGGNNCRRANANSMAWVSWR
jgi:hypothetical protein